MSRRSSPDLLALIDQAAAAGTRATGRNSLIQPVWVYDRGVDLVGLERFRQALTRGLLGRRVSASPLVFGRDRWLIAPKAPPIVVAPAPRPREAIAGWLDERAAAPIDPWTGPGWHLAVLPLEDGGSAVTLVVSHVLADWGGTATAIAEAVLGRTRDLPYPREAAPAWRAVLRDATLSARELPAAVRATRAARALSQERLAPAEGSATRAFTVGPDRWAVAPVDREPITARATALGGTETTLLVAVVAAIADALGWVRPSDGAAAISLSVDRRVEGDLRGNAIVDAAVVVDPGSGAADVAALRTTIRETLAGLPEAGRYDVFGPLIPLLPRRALAALIDAPVDPAEPVTTCAGIRELPGPVQSPDGSRADRTWARVAWSALPGREVGPRPAYLYAGWTNTERETSLYAATNLAAAGDLEAVLHGAVAKLSGERIGTPTPSDLR